VYPNCTRARQEKFRPTQAWAKREGRPVYLRDFGVYDKAPLEDRLKYTAAFGARGGEAGFAFECWQFDSEFVVCDIDNGAWS
jgi:endoglucanase